ncbi:Rieske (2Fe-2S) domain protein [Metallosphaera sedula]|uniref:Rieske (2Fe-2S) domain protein n=3 Tax=Metallosphaera TaxID=41980 RepID=A4YE25_METS5|nr:MULTISPECIES: Rieske iron-sulfur protein SoxL2 [Metallosphaera]AAS17977.1 SoxL2 [Metallosphaera sedula]ABP94677.1 Rieske (2Fe-2S) domain protein [Metallosphaera sedula DSM 5348]AIM26664.1 Rieske (2Fe-2S) domain protein [Metallosphaera sedula]AKV73632.1 Rieske (2Fe-2S) protein [Metallosphaera sedula]AKV75872.1 Rieske (2Fe-2S) protein [Metallosphaera sedula]
MPLKIRLGNGEKGVLKTSDLYFIQKLLRTMRNPKTRFDSREFVEKGEDYLFNYVGKNVGGIDEGRRNFLKGIVIGVAAATVVGIIPGLRVLVPPVEQATGFPKSLLVDVSGNPLKASSIPVNSPIITLYEYPLTGEPNFLLNLGDKSGNPVSIAPVEVSVPQTGKTYKFPGGVGPNNSIVSYSAICQHLGCTPPYIHFYPPNYVGPSQLTAPEPNTLTAQALLAAKQANIPALIHCDCHGSTYDPYGGGAVLTGPTQRPLPAVILEYDSSTDYLYAIGAIGVATYPEGSDGVPSQDPTKDLDTSQYGSSVGSKTQVQASTNPFSGS